MMRRKNVKGCIVSIVAMLLLAVGVLAGTNSVQAKGTITEEYAGNSGEGYFSIEYNGDDDVLLSWENLYNAYIGKGYQISNYDVRIYYPDITESGYQLDSLDYAVFSENYTTNGMYLENLTQNDIDAVVFLTVTYYVENGNTTTRSEAVFVTVEAGTRGASEEKTFYLRDASCPYEGSNAGLGSALTSATPQPIQTASVAPSTKPTASATPTVQPSATPTVTPSASPMTTLPPSGLYQTMLAKPSVLDVAISSNSSRSVVLATQMNGGSYLEYEIVKAKSGKSVLTGTLYNSTGIITGLKKSGFYGIHVRAVGYGTNSAKIYSDWSGYKYFISQPVINKNKSKINRHSIKVNWNKIEGASSYTLYMRKRNTKKWYKVKSLKKTKYVVKKFRGKRLNMKSGQQYELSVVAHGKKGSKKVKSLNNNYIYTYVYYTYH